jgi:hypothetical protein
MRRKISLVIALCVMVATAADLLYLLVFAPEWRIWLMAVSVLVFAAGAIWFYFDLRNVASNKRASR